MTKVRFCRIVSTVFALALLGCGAGSSVSKRFAVTLKAVDDDGKPLNEVKFTSGRSTIGTTNELGRVSVTIRGTEGQSVSLVVTCPGGYAVPEEAPKLRLTEVRRVGQSDISGIWVETVCTRKMRDVVVVVRTAGAVVPVDIGGKTQGTTDVNGNAHFRVALDREVRSLSVSLGTAEQPNLRPQNPSRVFELDGNDAILLVDQSFTTERKAPPRQASVPTGVAPRKRVPYRVDSGRFHAL